jgi:hypothetical protein
MVKSASGFEFLCSGKVVNLIVTSVHGMNFMIPFVWLHTSGVRRGENTIIKRTISAGQARELWLDAHDPQSYIMLHVGKLSRLVRAEQSDRQTLHPTFEEIFFAPQADQTFVSCQPIFFILLRLLGLSFRRPVCRGRRWTSLFAG